jgi:tRNA pseudouridine38-40 synthase
MRLKCTVAYDGSLFNGYQRQIKGRTVQGEIEKVLEKIHKEPIEIQASGRTDAGVHALNQVFHFDSSLDIAVGNWKRAINGLLPEDIYVKSVEVVSPNFHARYHVRTKEYRYYISLEEYNPLKYKQVYFHPQVHKLDIGRMEEAIKKLEGTHDFKLFTSGNEREYTIRTIFETKINILEDSLEIIFKGDGFLRYQVRVMVGTLIEIGENRRSIDTIDDLLALKRGIRAGRTAKPQGLYLYQVEYEDVD